MKDVQEQVTSSAVLNLDKDGMSKTLGVQWNPKEDTFQYSIKIKTPASCTKRMMVSSIAQIFDPLGLLAPVIVTAKLLIQHLWKLNVGWDESLPEDIFMRWVNYVADIQYLNNFVIRRQVIEKDTGIEIQIHGFCDASERAYGACVYIRTISKDNTVQVYLLCAKSRVASIRALSIPKLELCGAQLLAQLISKVKRALNVKIKKIYYWTDSSIVLHWIKATKRLSVFVAHRVGDIQESTAIKDWGHIGTKENPADLVSRGCTPKQLSNAQLWWGGPPWLKNKVIPGIRSETKDIEESTSSQEEEQIMLATNRGVDDKFIHRFSTFQRLVRVTATCIKFSHLCRRKNEVDASKPLSVQELEYAKACLVKMEQLFSFEAEISALRKKKTIPTSSGLKHLNPWLDNQGLL